MQLPLLNSQPQSQIEITGLEYFSNFITQAKSDELLKIIDTQPWLHDLKRRVQHYGWKYDYTARRITKDLYLGNLPNWLQNLADDLMAKGIFENAPDQVIINEYQAWQGISAHISPSIWAISVGMTTLKILAFPALYDFTISKQSVMISILVWLTPEEFHLSASLVNFE